MGITQRNEYLPAQDLNNLSANVDDTRINGDLSRISVDFGTTPATVTVEVGSLIEVNGNTYLITTDDETFQMSSATDNYITFTDNPSTAFGSASSKGSYNTPKQGYYQAGNLIRTLGWFIDQTNESYFKIDLDNQPEPHCAVTMSTDFQSVSGVAAEQPIQFDTIEHDTTNSFNTGTYTYVVPEDGYYQSNAHIVLTQTANDGTVYLSLRVNGFLLLQSRQVFYDPTGAREYQTYVQTRTLYLKQGDSVYMGVRALVSSTSISGNADLGIIKTIWSIDKLYF